MLLVIAERSTGRPRWQLYTVGRQQNLSLIRSLPKQRDRGRENEEGDRVGEVKKNVLKKIGETKE